MIGACTFPDADYADGGAGAGPTSTSSATSTSASTTTTSGTGSGTCRDQCKADLTLAQMQCEEACDICAAPECASMPTACAGTVGL